MGRQFRAGITHRLPMLVLALMSALLAPIAASQSHEREVGTHLVRSNVVRSMFLDPGVARNYGIAPAPDRAILIVMVARSGTTPLQPVKAEVAAWIMRDAAPQPIPMHEMVVNDGVSYLGVFQFVPGEDVDLKVEAQPATTTDRVELQFRESMPQP